MSPAQLRIRTPARLAVTSKRRTMVGLRSLAGWRGGLGSLTLATVGLAGCQQVEAAAEPDVRAAFAPASASAKHALGGRRVRAPAPTVKLPAPIVLTHERIGLIDGYPCNSCHSLTALPSSSRNSVGGSRGRPDGSDPPPGTQMNRGPHSALQVSHPKSIKDCTLCHNREDRNTLQLLSGEAISFNESHRLCAQCHAEKGADFEIGSHGKRVGSWKGTATRFACTDCHNPHSPAIAPVEARPAPPFPKLGIRKEPH